MCGMQDTMRAPAENKKMKKAATLSIAVTTFYYLTIGVIGYAGELCWLIPDG